MNYKKQIKIKTKFCKEFKKIKLKLKMNSKKYLERILKIKKEWKKIKLNNQRSYKTIY